jgi:hypothetical protein
MGGWASPGRLARARARGLCGNVELILAATVHANSVAASAFFFCDYSIITMIYVFFMLPCDVEGLEVCWGLLGTVPGKWLERFG